MVGVSGISGRFGSGMERSHLGMPTNQKSWSEIEIKLYKIELRRYRYSQQDLVLNQNFMQSGFRFAHLPRRPLSLSV